MSDTLSLPTLIVALILLFLAVRILMPRGGSSSSSSSTRANSGFPGSSSSSSTSSVRVDPARINQVAAMFPQLDRRSIAWDLHRNGGSVAGTTERVLAGRGLDAAPRGWVFNGGETEGAGTGAGRGMGAGMGAAGAQGEKKKVVDLITRYKLEGRIRDEEARRLEGLVEDRGDVGSEGDKAGAGGAKGKSTGWASTKAERANLLARRREDMILAARRKMLEKQVREEKGKGKAVEG